MRETRAEDVASRGIAAPSAEKRRVDAGDGEDKLLPRPGRCARARRTVATRGTATALLTHPRRSTRRGFVARAMSWPPRRNGVARTAVIALVTPGAVRNRVCNNEHVFSRSCIECREPRQHRRALHWVGPITLLPHLVDSSLPPCRDHHGAHRGAREHPHRRRRARARESEVQLPRPTVPRAAIAPAPVPRRRGQIAGADVRPVRQRQNLRARARRVRDDTPGNTGDRRRQRRRLLPSRRRRLRRRLPQPLRRHPPQPARGLVTSAFVHVDAFHLLSNMQGVLQDGSFLEGSGRHPEVPRARRDAVGAVAVRARGLVVGGEEIVPHGRGQAGGRVARRRRRPRVQVRVRRELPRLPRPTRGNVLVLVRPQAPALLQQRRGRLLRR